MPPKKTLFGDRAPAQPVAFIDTETVRRNGQNVIESVPLKPSTALQQHLLKGNALGPAPSSSLATVQLGVDPLRRPLMTTISAPRLLPSVAAQVEAKEAACRREIEEEWLHIFSTVAEAIEVASLIQEQPRGKAKRTEQQQSGMAVFPDPVYSVPDVLDSELQQLFQKLPSIPPNLARAVFAGGSGSRSALVFSAVLSMFEELPVGCEVNLLRVGAIAAVRVQEASKTISLTSSITRQLAASAKEEIFCPLCAAFCSFASAAISSGCVFTDDSALVLMAKTFLAQPVVADLLLLWCFSSLHRGRNAALCLVNGLEVAASEPYDPQLAQNTADIAAKLLYSMPPKWAVAVPDLATPAAVSLLRIGAQGSASVVVSCLRGLMALMPRTSSPLPADLILALLGNMENQLQLAAVCHSAGVDLQLCKQRLTETFCKSQ